MALKILDVESYLSKYKKILPPKIREKLVQIQITADVIREFLEKLEKVGWDLTRVKA